MVQWHSIRRETTQLDVCLYAVVFSHKQDDYYPFGDYQSLVSGVWTDDATEDWYTIRALDQLGNVVATASKSTVVDTSSREFVLAPPASSLFTSIEVEIDGDEDFTFDYASAAIDVASDYFLDLLSSSISAYQYGVGGGIKVFAIAYWNKKATFAANPYIDIDLPFLSSLAVPPYPYAEISFKITITGTIPDTYSIQFDTGSTVSGTRKKYTDISENEAEIVEFISIFTTISKFSVRFKTDYSGTALTTLKVEASIQQAPAHRIKYSGSNIYNICSANEVV